MSTNSTSLGQSVRFVRFVPSCVGLLLSVNVTNAQWTLVVPRDHTGLESPQDRQFHAMTELADGSVFLHGGNDGNYLGDSWIWCDGWANVTEDGPTRGGHALAFDSTHNVIVLYGGHDVTDETDATWHWTAASGWEEITVVGDVPPRRQNHAMTYDSTRHVVVMFGGQENGTCKSDTWEYDTQTNIWTHRCTDCGPNARESHVMTYVTGTGVLLHGGNNGQYLDDTWIWDGDAWDQIANGPPRAGHDLAYDVRSGRVVLFGGHDESDEEDETWRWTSSGGWVQLLFFGPVPSARQNVAMAINQFESEVVVFGGQQDGKLFGDTWTYQAASACPADLNLDGFVGAADLAIMLGHWGSCPADDCCPYDLAGTSVGVVSPADLAALLGQWGPCP